MAYVYIYKNGDHHATVKVNMLPKVEEIRADVPSSVTEGENVVAEVVSGGGGYKKQYVSEEFLNVSVKEDGSELVVKGIKPGEGYFTLKDRYNQTSTFRVKVRDVSLQLQGYELTLNRGQTEELYIHEYYKGIKPLKKNNENVRVWLETDKNGEKYLLIKGEKEGESIIQVEDAQGNVKSVRVTVGAGSGSGGEGDSDDNGGGSGEADSGSGNQNDEFDFDVLLEDLMKEIDNESNVDGVEVNSVEELNELGFSTKKAESIVKKLEKIRERIDSRLQDPIDKIKILKQVINILEGKKGKITWKNNLINYINYNLQSYIKDYQIDAYMLNIDNPFKKMYATEMQVLTRELEMRIELELMKKLGVTREYIDEEFGGMFSKKGLDYMREHNIITLEEYDQFNSYIPSVESLVKSLEEEGSMHELLKTYFPEDIGASDGYKQAVKDYLEEYIDMLDPRDIPMILLGVTKGLKDILSGEYTLSDLGEDVGDLYDIVINIDEILAGLDEYKKAYYKSYAGTSFSLVAIPVKYGAAAKKLKREESVDMKQLKDWSKIAFIDKNTILGNKSVFTDTGRRYNGSSAKSRIYKNKDTGYYYYRDTAGVSGDVGHQHLEVFDKKYNHIGTADPVTGMIDYSKVESGRNIKSIMK